MDVAQRVADGARERVVRVRISASRFCRKPSLRVPGALAQCLAVGAVFGRDRVRRVILLFSLATRVFLVAAAAAAGHLGRGVHHHRGRAGWCVGTGGIAESRAKIERRKLGSVSRDSSGWIARPRRQETRGSSAPLGMMACAPQSAKGGFRAADRAVPSTGRTKVDQGSTAADRRRPGKRPRGANACARAERVRRGARRARASTRWMAPIPDPAPPDERCLNSEVHKLSKNKI